jgi:hypothetical protein
MFFYSAADPAVPQRRVCRLSITFVPATYTLSAAKLKRWIDQLKSINPNPA